MVYYNNMSNRSYRTIRDVAMGLLVGLLSGLFGVGGGIVLVPLLVLLFKTEQKRAQATSLVVVALSSLSGAVTYSISGTVNWLSVPLLIAGGVVGTLIGTALVRKINDRWLKLGFGILLLVVAGRFFFEAFVPTQAQLAEFGVLTAIGYLAAGFAMGLLSSFLGVGGGVVVIPMLVGLFGFAQQLAAGTALVVMMPLTLLGAWRLSKAGFTDWGQGLRIGAAAAVAAVGGASLALVSQPSALQFGFALLLVLAGAQMIWKALK